MVIPVANSPMVARNARASTTEAGGSASGVDILGLTCGRRGAVAGRAQAFRLFDVTADKLAYPVHVGLAVVPLGHGAGHAHRIAARKALLQPLPRPAGRHGRVRGHTGEGEAVGRLQT